MIIPYTGLEIIYLCFMDLRGFKFKDEAQASLEYIVVLGLAFLALIVVMIIIHIMMSSGKIIVDINSAEIAVGILREGADNVYVLGHPAKTRRNIYIPEGVFLTDVRERMIRFRIDVGSVEGSYYTDVYAVTSGNVTGYLCPGACHEGNYVVVFDSIAPGGREDVKITLAE